ncbi:conserved hypothetical protein [Neospora caninum Liverpool]|uniref:Transmembrane protein n=1 Tax=Neospora caninum (strain Liverpool) TaxID=572307 RepID=F0VPY7_NEOCL|nr:conserved hypothetical protein [Neospora caninum Liverpool]CBZ55784.1 conserved hypothetical protein [Neospora caninum Liverpool]CEL70527.1 TPA: hypothetical protein BN1204_062100 [Neospora caninum Liverpool]|eukprot:XP_003885810.1 conserved hypothetical protein [Neospora caninum Liverpool]
MAAATASRGGREGRDFPAAPPRRSLLREVLSEAELTELGLDASVDDSPSAPPSISRKRFHGLFLLSALWVLLYWGSFFALLVYLHPEAHRPPDDLQIQRGVYVHVNSAGARGGRMEAARQATEQKSGGSASGVEARNERFQGSENGGQGPVFGEGRADAYPDSRASALPSVDRLHSVSPPSLSSMGSIRAYTTADALNSVDADAETARKAGVSDEASAGIDDVFCSTWAFLLALSVSSVATELGVLYLLRSFTPLPHREGLLAFPLASPSAPSALLSTVAGSLTLLLDFVSHFCQLGDVLFLFAVAPPLFPLPLFLCCLYSVALTTFFLLLLQLRSLLAVHPRDRFALHDGPAACLRAPVALLCRPRLLSALRVLVACLVSTGRLLVRLLSLAFSLCLRVPAACQACLRPRRLRAGALAPAALAPLHAAAQRRLFRRDLDASCCAEGDAGVWGEPSDREQSLIGAAAVSSCEASLPPPASGLQGDEHRREEKDAGSLPPAACSHASPSRGLSAVGEGGSQGGFASSSRVSGRIAEGRTRQGARAQGGGILQQVLHGFLQAKRPSAGRSEGRGAFAARAESPGVRAPHAADALPSAQVSLLSPSSSCAFVSTSFFAPERDCEGGLESVETSRKSEDGEEERRERRDRRERGVSRRGEDAERKSEEEGRTTTSRTGNWARGREGEDGEAAGETQDFADGSEVMKLTNHFLLLDMAAATDALKNHFLPAEKLEAFEFGASLLSLSRFYLGDLCLLFFLAYPVCAFGSASLPVVLLLFHCAKILLQTLLFLLKSDASIWELWCYDLD